MSDDGNIREKLLKSARKIFAQKGFEAASVRQICDDAGVNAALISYYFGGKDKIFAELFRNFFPNDGIKEMIKLRLEPDEAVKLLIREVLTYKANNPELIQIIQFEIMTGTERAAVIREYAYPIWEGLREWLREGKELGIFRFQSLDTALALLISALLFSLSNPYWNDLFQGGLSIDDSFIEETTDFILAGLHYKPLER